MRVEWMPLAGVRWSRPIRLGGYRIQTLSADQILKTTDTRYLVIFTLLIIWERPA